MAKLIGTVENNRDGNDCYFYETYLVMDDAGKRYILLHTRVTGWSEEDSWKPITLKDIPGQYRYRIAELYLS